MVIMETDDRVTEIRVEIAKAMGDLATDLLNGVDPFIGLTYPKEATSHLYLKCLEYSNELEKSFRQEILDSQIEFSRFTLHNAITRKFRAFGKMEPEHCATEAKFSNWLKEREPEAYTWTPRALPPLEPGIKVKKNIKQVMKERKPEFYEYKSKNLPGLFTFAKDWLSDNKILITFDKPPNMREVDVAICLEKPFFILDVGYFFASTHSGFKFDSAANLEKAVEKAIDTVDLLLPHILERIEKVLARFEKVPYFTTS